MEVMMPMIHTHIHHETLLFCCHCVSLSVLVITVVYKAPQVYAVLHSGSSRGICLTSLILEFGAYTGEMTYQIGMGYPLDTYYEITLMWAQDLLFLFVVLENRKLMRMNLLAYAAIYGACSYAIMARLLPDVLMFSVLVMTIPIETYSKIAQLRYIYRTKDPGSLSALSWGLLTYMAAARILTACVITGDRIMLTNTTIATVLNTAVTIAILYFNHKKQNQIQIPSTSRATRGPQPRTKLGIRAKVPQVAKLPVNKGKGKRS